MKPRCLDLFGGAQGAAVGYARAGFEVWTVDREYHRTAPLPQVVADAMEVLRDRRFIASFDLLTAGPPCQENTSLRYWREGVGQRLREHGENLVGPVRELLVESGKPYVIENVMGAELLNPVRVCGSSFGLKVRRHRLFESNVELEGSVCQHRQQGTPVGVYGSGGPKTPGGRGTRAKNLAEMRSAMGINWMGRADIVEAIPPAYTEFLGGQLLRALGAQGDRCERCGDSLQVPEREQGGGRVKRFCSSRCRTAAHRSSRA